MLIKHLLGMNTREGGGGGGGTLPQFPLKREEDFKPRGRDGAACLWGLEMQYCPECFSAGQSSGGNSLGLPVCGTWLSSGGAPGQRVQRQTVGRPDAMVTEI